MDGEGSKHNSAHRKSEREGDDGGCGAYRCFGSGRCGSARSNIQAGPARAHTAAVPVLWDNVQLAKSAELHPSSPLASLSILFCRDTCVFPPVQKATFSERAKGAFMFFSFLS